MITLYSGPVSWFSRKVEVALYEKGLPFTQVIVPFAQTSGYQPKHKEVTRINPKAQVPAMIDGDLELYDSSIIIEYLDESYPNPSLLPTSPDARARCRLWDNFGDEVMLKPISHLMHRTEPIENDSIRWRELETRAATALHSIETHFEHLDNNLQHTNYLCGDFSLADISCLMPVFWSCRLAGPAFGNRLHLKRWYRNLMSRTSFAKVTDEIKAQDKLLSTPVAGAFTGC